MAAIEQAILPQADRDFTVGSKAPVRDSGEDKADFLSVFNEVEQREAQKKDPAERVDLRRETAVQGDEKASATQETKELTTKALPSEEGKQTPMDAAEGELVADEASNLNVESFEEPDTKLEEVVAETTQQETLENEEYSAAERAANDFIAKLQAASDMETRLSLTNASQYVRQNDAAENATHLVSDDTEAAVTPEADKGAQTKEALVSWFNAVTKAVTDETSPVADTDIGESRTKAATAPGTGVANLVAKSAQPDEVLTELPLSEEAAEELLTAGETLKQLPAQARQALLSELKSAFDKTELSHQEKAELNQLVARLRSMSGEKPATATASAEVQEKSPVLVAAPQQSQLLTGETTTQLDKVGNAVIAALLGQDAPTEDRLTLSEAAKESTQSHLNQVGQKFDAVAINATAETVKPVVDEVKHLELPTEEEPNEMVEPQMARESKLVSMLSQLVQQLSGQESATATPALNNDAEPQVASQFVQHVEAASKSTGETRKIHLDAATMQALNLARSDAAKALHEKVSMMLNLNNKEAEIRLDPPELGSMQIRVRSDAEQAQINFVVQNQQAKEMLEQSLPRLRDMLAQQGINLGESSIEQGGQGAWQGEGGEQQMAGGGQGAESLNQEDPQQAVKPAEYGKSTEQGIDFYA